MSQREKLIVRIRARPPEADFRDVRALLEDFGWEMRNQRGSHCTFKTKGELPIVFPIKDGRRVERPYLIMICERLGLDN